MKKPAPPKNFKVFTTISNQKGTETVKNGHVVNVVGNSNKPSEDGTPSEFSISIDATAGVITVTASSFWKIQVQD